MCELKNKVGNGNAATTASGSMALVVSLLLLATAAATTQPITATAAADPAAVRNAGREGAINLRGVMMLLSCRRPGRL